MNEEEDAPIRRRWRETAKGYAIRAVSLHGVVFWDKRQHAWKSAFEGEFSPPFPNLAAALEAVERRIGLAGAVDRTYCRDVPPEYRHMRDADIPRQPPPDPRREELRAARTQVQNELRNLRERIRASIRRPAWATTLGLPGAGPWSLVQVRAAYVALARRHHPDRQGDPAVMIAVNQAWEVAQQVLTPCSKL